MNHKLNLFLLIVISTFFLGCNTSEPKNDSVQDKFDFLEEMSEFNPIGNFEKEIVFQVVTKDPEEIEIFGDTLIPWISIENAKSEVPNLAQKEELVLEVQSAILVIDYPVESPIQIEINSNDPKGFTRQDLVIQISENYLRIYKEEEESTSVAVTPMEEREIINRNTTDGKYGIWGHDLIDLDLSGIEVRKDGDITYLYLYVES
ncbi:MAG: hypothetical protein ABJG68_12605 [Crocinitomicaceae bacterium]